MASGTWKWYGQALIAAFNKEIDLLDDSIKVMITASSHTPDQDIATPYKDDIVAAEVTGTNWPAGGVAVANDTLSYTAGTNVLKYDSDDVSVATVTLSDGKNLHLYDSTPGSDAARPLLAYCVLDAALNPSAGTLAITMDSGGILTMTAAA